MFVAHITDFLQHFNLNAIDNFDIKRTGIQQHIWTHFIWHKPIIFDERIIHYVYNYKKDRYMKYIQSKEGGEFLLISMLFGFPKMHHILNDLS